jgi:hypothetical protein
MAEKNTWATKLCWKSLSNGFRSTESQSAVQFLFLPYRNIEKFYVMSFITVARLFRVFPVKAAGKFEKILSLSKYRVN